MSVTSLAEKTLEIAQANFEDVSIYTAYAREAQLWLRDRGYRQYVPAAHDEYFDSIQSKVANGTLFVVRNHGEVVGFFALELAPSAWWPDDKTSAVYLSGMVVASSSRGLGVGGNIIEWCAAETKRIGRHCVRLDCHAENSWLCSYYETHGFKLRGRVQQHGEYYGCLYERSVS